MLGALLAASLALLPGSTDDPLAADPASLSSPPSEMPPPPPADPSAPLESPLVIDVSPDGQEEVLGDGSQPPDGQWVGTEQYGWVFMPYGDDYTELPSNGEGQPYEYVYYPAYGWAWVVAPWVWGLGPWPYFGSYGASRFGWYGHGYWRSPARWHYTGPAPARGGLALHGLVPAPVAGSSLPKAAPVASSGVFVARGIPERAAGKGSVGRPKNAREQGARGERR